MKKTFVRNTEEEEKAIALHAREDDTALTDAELVEFEPIANFPKQVARIGRPPKETPKQSTTIRFDADILEAFKASGKGWQTRINNALREYLETNGTTLQG